jgi:hypothetical protein
MLPLPSLASSFEIRALERQSLRRCGLARVVLLPQLSLFWPAQLGSRASFCVPRCHGCQNVRFTCCGAEMSHNLIDLALLGDAPWFIGEGERQQ